MLRTLALGSFLLLTLTRCDQLAESEPEAEFAPTIEIQDVIIGDGPVAEEGTLVSITYIAKRGSGSVIDNADQGLLFNVHAWTKVYTFVVGSSSVIEGLSQGVVGMRPGGSRIVTIPPHLAFPDGVEGLLPARTTITLEIEMLQRPDIEILRTGQGPFKVAGDVAALSADVKLPDGSSVINTLNPLTIPPSHDIILLLLGARHSTQRDEDIPFSTGYRDALEVIVGLHYGILGMQGGEQRRITVPPSLGFGEAGFRNVVPPNATLTIDIELFD